MNYLVSVLMCVYNTPIEFLKEAINSILDQTYKNLEFVIVDDASDLAEVVSYLDYVSEVDNRITLLHNKTNLGLTKSLNVGLDRCNGVYIARMDSDDISLPERIHKQVEYMESHPDVALLGSNIISFGEGIRENDSSTIEDRCDDPEIYRISSMFENPGPPHSSFMFRASLLKEKKIKYREDIKKAQDYGIIVDILKVGGIINKIKTPLVKYRVHGGQITTNNEIEQMAYRCRVSYNYIGFLFPALTDIELGALSLLGCSAEWDKLIESIKNVPELKRICGYIIENRDEMEKSQVYIKAIKKIVRLNKQKEVFDKATFASEIKYRWWKKALRMTQASHRIWGFNLFTLGSCFYVINRYE